MAGWILVAGVALTLPTIAQDAGTQRPPPINNPVETQRPPTNRTAPDGGGSRAPARGGRVPSLDELFTTLDKDHDGKMSKAEATGPYTQRFSQWDANGDGFASRQEIHDFRLRLGIDDNGQRMAGSGPGGTNTVPAAAGGAADSQGARGAGGNTRDGARRAGTTVTATILKAPADWRFEGMPIPPGFAPEIKLTGSEEVRFAPGMFDTTSSNYFTCVLAIMAEGVSELGAADIQDFLEKYYRGLGTGVDRRKGLSPDPAQCERW